MQYFVLSSCLILVLLFIHVESIQVCGEREVYSQCDAYHCNRNDLCCQPRCPESLDKFLNPGPVCIKEICTCGCLCAEGYVKDRKTKECIRKQYCATVGDPNEHFSKCGAACQPKCNCPKCQGGGFCCTCTKECQPGYVCNEGYARNSTGWCVPNDKC